ncbi:MAG: Rne/Rng family ribonuclease [Desulfobacterales bacterium]|jgi:ribonuclease G|nr:Rne/Rng family ribonuclease [Desulfobacterales bacterium]
MYRKLVINVTEPETRVALLEDGTMVELMIERREDANIAGNVYKGKVCRVLPGMQAAFLDIGLNQSAFIHVNDLNTNNYKETQDIFSEPKDAAVMLPEVGASSGDEPVLSAYQSIEDIIREGEEILVQVAKSPLGSKGARVTSHISLPGRFLVLMPGSDRIGVSRRIEDEHERERLKEQVLSLSQGQMGYIVRTATEGIGAEKLAYEMGFLKNLWENIQIKFKTSTAPALLHKELSVSLRAVRDLLTHEADKVIIDSCSEYETVLAFLEGIMPSLKSSVELYEGHEAIFDAFNLMGDISRALNRKVWLKSGGYIVLEHTEALMAIDVNTGRYVGKHNLEETILKTNLEAVKEIAYQIRLRDIGGIIIIDFIDMEKKANQEKVFNALKGEMKKDKSKTHILPISEMGLVQMTRKRIREPLPRVLCEPCYYCEGQGYLLSKRTICYNIYRDIIREGRDSMGGRIALRVNPLIADLLHGEENYLIGSLERTVGKQIVIYPDEKFHLEQYDILEILKQ